jgi:hypothetical protein
VVSADVTIARLRSRTIGVGRGVFKDFKIGSELAAEEPNLFHDGARVHVEMIGHPVFVTLEWTKFIDQFATNDVSEEDRCFLYIGHGEANVVGSP